jgi:hypothetical protein
MTFLILFVAAVAAGAPARMLSPGQQWTWNGEIANGAALEISGVTGDIHAIPSASGRVEVSATIDDASGVEMRVVETGGGVAVCATRKGSPECAATPEGAPSARIDYAVRVPKGVRLIAKTINGGIQAESLGSDVEASTVNGRVAVSTTGSVRASTVNGSIVAKLLKPFWRMAPRFSAVNGPISVVIPANVKTGIRAETRNGKIVQDLPAFRGASSDQKLDGTVGSGAGTANPLVIRTINGAIELKQRP